MLETVIIAVLGVLVIIEGVIILMIDSNFYLIEKREDKRK